VTFGPAFCVAVTSRGWNLVGDAQAECREHAAGELPDAAEHHHQERVDDVALTEVRADVADLAERHTAEAGDARTEAEGEHVHTTGRHAAASGHVAVLGDGTNVEAEAGFIQQQPRQHHHEQGESNDDDAVVRQHKIGQHLNTAGQPRRVGHFNVLRAEQQTHQLDQHQADAPRREQGFQWSAVEVTNHRALQRHADCGRDKKRHRQRDQRVELNRLWRIALEHQLHHIRRVGAEHQHLAVGHVDHPEQTEGDGQTEGRQQQNRTEGHAAEGLTEDLADQQFAFDLSQAGFGGGAHVGIGFNAGFEQTFEARTGEWIAGFAEQSHRGEAHRRVSVDQLQIGQRQAQGGVNAFIFFANELLVEEFQLRGFRAFLQLLRGAQTDFGVGGEQLVAGHGGVDQTPQAIVQAQGFRLAVDGQFALLQGVDQFDTGRVGLRGPGFQQSGLLHGIGRDEVFGVAGVGQHRQQ
jgi:hypothetical protein